MVLSGKQQRPFCPFMELIPEIKYRKLANVAEHRDAAQQASENHNQMRDTITEFLPLLQWPCRKVRYIYLNRARIFGKRETFLVNVSYY